MRLEVVALRHTYPGHARVERPVLTIGAWQADTGSRWLLRGVSGSGKTTFLNILAGLLPPTEGTVRIGDEVLYDLPETMRDQRRATSLGYVYQAHVLVPILDTLENVELPLRFGGRMSAADRRDRAHAMLERVGLADHARHRPAQLSMGQRQRVAVARALVIEPLVVLADEPTAALDRANAATVLDLLIAYSVERSATLVVASHDPALGERFEHAIDLGDGELQGAAA